MIDHKTKTATPSAKFAKLFGVPEGEANAALFYIAGDIATANGSGAKPMPVPQGKETQTPRRKPWDPSSRNQS